jgi:hypothetical protein
MSKKPVPGERNNQPARCEIWLKGHLDKRWEKRFDSLSITMDENGNTLLTGQVADQTALHGLLKKVRDLGLTLLSVSYVEPGIEEAHQI